MARAVPPLALLGLALAGCVAAPPPPQLGGLWSAGPAACAAGVGVRFGPNAIEAVYDRDVETLFAHPRYEVETGGDVFRVRIVYDLPELPNGISNRGAHGVLVLAQQPDGSIAPERHALIDARTGAARTRLVNDPAAALLSLQPCGAHPWREELRGRAEI
jgi:hypothetical protein